MRRQKESDGPCLFYFCFFFNPPQRTACLRLCHILCHDLVSLTLLTQRPRCPRAISPSEGTFFRIPLVCMRNSWLGPKCCQQMTDEIYDMDFWKTSEIDLNHTIAAILRSRSIENVSNVSKSYTLSLSLRRKILKWPTSGMPISKKVNRYTRRHAAENDAGASINMRSLPASWKLRHGKIRETADCGANAGRVFFFFSFFSLYFSFWRFERGGDSRMCAEQRWTTNWKLGRAHYNRRSISHTLNIVTLHSAHDARPSFKAAVQATRSPVTAQKRNREKSPSFVARRTNSQ